MEITRLTREVLEELESKSQYEQYELLQQYYLKNTSNYYFPNDLIAFYPRIIERRASRDIVCNISEVIISKGSYYINYRPLLENLNTKKTYVLKRTICCSLCYDNMLPTNIFELEELNDRIRNPNTDSDEISMETLRNYGEIKLLQLNKSRRNYYDNCHSK